MYKKILHLTNFSLAIARRYCKIALILFKYNAVGNHA